MTTPRRHSLSRWLAILIPASATMVVALAAIGVLHRFLIVRERLGPWQLTVRDDHGVVMGGGQAAFTVEHWSCNWSWSPPFLEFSPELGGQVGTLTMTDAGMAAQRTIAAEDPTWTVSRAFRLDSPFYIAITSTSTDPDDSTQPIATSWGIACVATPADGGRSRGITLTSECARFGSWKPRSPSAPTTFAIAVTR